MSAVGGASRTVSSTYAHKGTAAGRLGINPGAPASMSLKANIDATLFSMLRVHFWFYPTGFRYKDDFRLQYSENGGTSWTTITSWIYPTNFQNNGFYDATVYIHRSQVTFNDQFRIRFTADVSDDFDQVYFDEIELAGK